jgi:hypothetical protein
MRARLSSPREVLASLPVERREAIVLGLGFCDVVSATPRASGYAWDFVDLGPR